MHTRRMVVARWVLCALFASVAAVSAGDHDPARPLAEMVLGASRVDWRAAGNDGALALTVAGPGELWLRKEFAAGQPPSLSLFDKEGQPLPEGVYVYEIRLLAREGDAERPILQTGSFAIRGGRFAPAFERNRAPGKVESITEAQVQNITAASEVIADNLVVQGNACLGDECETDDADTTPVLRLKSTSPGIFFEDVWDGFSSDRDWQLQASPSIGGSDHFYLRDVDASTTPLSIQGGAPTSSLVVASDGKIGFGTATPGAQVHLYKSATSDAIVGMGTDPVSGPAFNVGYGGTSFGRGSGFLNVRPDASATAPNPSIRLMTVNVERMIVTNAGNVGIGTSAPSSKLHVNGGDIRVSGGAFIDDGVTLNAPDYVFEPSYSLMPLAELREFISREKHLPNVPSAAEIRNGGLNLSQFQMRLLEKIEELALYTLEQEEDLRSLREENRELEARLEALEEGQGAIEPE
jgi:hypothetical protein